VNSLFDRNAMFFEPFRPRFEFIVRDGKSYMTVATGSMQWNFGRWHACRCWIKEQQHGRSAPKKHVPTGTTTDEGETENVGIKPLRRDEVVDVEARFQHVKRIYHLW
jgi:hypothetical protein